MRFRFAAAIIALVMPMMTIVHVTPTHCILRISEFVYGRVTACASPKQMLLTHNPRTALPMQHKIRLFGNLNAIKVNHTALTIDNR